MNKNKHEPKEPVWTVREVTTKGATPDKNKVELQLLANGVCMHRCSSGHAYAAVQAYVDDLNARQVSAPAPGGRLRADGWSQPRDLDQVPKSIPAEVFNYQIP